MSNISNSVLFENFEKHEIQTALKYFETKKIKKNIKIITEGKSDSSLFILLEGKIKIDKQLVFDFIENHTKTLAVLSGKDKPVFGEISLLCQNKRTATVKTLSECIVLKLSKKKFEKLKKDNLETAFKIITNIAKLIAMRLQKTDNNLVKMTTAFSIAITEN